MEPKHKEAMRAANRRRGIACRRCGVANLTFLDGDDCGGLSGIIYKYCGACGDAQPTKRTKVPS